MIRTGTDDYKYRYSWYWYLPMPYLQFITYGRDVRYI